MITKLLTVILAGVVLGAMSTGGKMDPRPHRSYTPPPNPSQFTATIAFDVASFETPLGVALEVRGWIPGSEPAQYAIIESHDVDGRLAPVVGRHKIFTFSISRLPPGDYVFRYVAFHSTAPDVVIDDPVPVQGSGH